MKQMPNGSFEYPWRDVDLGGRTVQQPQDWTIVALPVGANLRSTGAFPDDDPPVHEVVRVLPDVVHMNANMLPPDEHLGGSKALILDGEWALKVFNAAGPFGLRMVCDIQCPEDSIRLYIPIQVHQHGDGSTGAAAFRVGVDGSFTRWYTFNMDFEDRKWFYVDVQKGSTERLFAHVAIDLESRSEAGIDFWLDNLEYEPVNGVSPNQPRNYERTFFLLPDKWKLTRAEFDWLMLQLGPQLYEGQYTFGFSADDAGVGMHLIKRTIYVVSVHESDWDREALEDFYNTYWPGAELHHIFMRPHISFPVGTDKYPPEMWYVPLSQLFSAQHPGIDINLDVYPWGDVERGEPVFAMLDGKVHYVTHDWSGIGMCVVKHTLHDTPYWVMYAHIDVGSLAVGQEVPAGYILGLIDDWRGGDGGDHLHLGVSTAPVTREYLTHKGWIDPVEWMKRFLPPEIVDAMITRGTAPPPPTPPHPPVPAPAYLRSNNVLCLHSGEPCQHWDTYWMQSGANAMKVFSLGFAMEAKRIVPDPNAIVLWRKHSDYTVGVDSPPTALLDRYSDEIGAYCRNTGESEESVVDRIDAIESLNEEIPTFNLAQLRKAVDFDVGFAEVLHQRYGSAIKPALLNVAIGNPHESEVQYLLPAAKAAVLYGGFVCYHAYWTANEHRSFLTEHWDYHAGRWMRWDDFFRAQGVYPRYLLSEGGIVYAWDGLSFHSGLGWRSCGPFVGYMKDMDVFHGLVRTWNYEHSNRCIGLALFCHGNWGWDNFELGSGNVLEMAHHSVLWR